MKYKTKDILVNVVLYTGENISEVLAAFPNLSASGTTLKDAEGMNISANTYIVELPNGSYKYLRGSLFSELFEVYEEPTYSLSEIEITTGTKLKKKDWGEGKFIAYQDVCWVHYHDGKAELYTLTPSDLAAADWQVV